MANDIPCHSGPRTEMTIIFSYHSGPRTEMADVFQCHSGPRTEMSVILVDATLVLGQPLWSYAHFYRVGPRWQDATLVLGPDCLVLTVWSYHTGITL